MKNALKLLVTLSKAVWSCRISTNITFTELDVTSALFYTSNAQKQRETNARLSSIVIFREQRHVNVSKAYWMSSLSLHPFARRQSAWRVHSDLLVQTKIQYSYEWRRKKFSKLSGFEYSREKDELTEQNS